MFLHRSVAQQVVYNLITWFSTEDTVQSYSSRCLQYRVRKITCQVNIKADLLDRGESANAKRFVYKDMSAISSQEAVLFNVFVINYFRDNQTKNSFQW